MVSEAAPGLSLGRRLRVAGPPAALYLATALAALAAFGWVAQSRSETEVAYVLRSVLVVGGPGVILGQAAAILRLRTWLFLGLLVANHYLFLEVWDLAVGQGWDPSALEIFATAPGGEREFYELFLQLGALAAAGGFWSLTPRMEALSCFFPTLFITSVLVAPLTPQEVSEIWSGTEKWRVWVQPAFSWLCGWVIFLTLFLAFAGRRRRQLEGQRARSARGTSWAVSAFALLLCAVTALFGPYLVQTVPVEGVATEEGRGGKSGSSGESPPPPPQTGQSGGREADTTGSGGGDRGTPSGAGEAGAEAEGGAGEPPPGPARRADESGEEQGSDAGAGSGPGDDSAGGESTGDGSAGDGSIGEGEGGEAPSGSLLPQTLGILLFLLLLYLLSRLLRKGLRRNFIVHRLLEEGRPEPPTARLRRAWDIAALALREQGHEAAPAESAGDFVRRLKLEAEGIRSLGPAETCAELFDRARFGLFLGPEDPERARTAALAAYGEAWESLSLGRRLKALLRASLLP